MLYVGIDGTCWVWHGAQTGKSSRGVMGVNGRNKAATHVAWFLAHGEWPKYPHRSVLHTCDNPTCVRPSHLFIGTILDNRRDAIEKKRQHGVGPVTAKAIREDRKLGMCQAALALKYGVNRSTISKIVTRKTYADIP
jgi:hypothetical protein